VAPRPIHAVERTGVPVLGPWTGGGARWRRADADCRRRRESRRGELRRTHAVGRQPISYNGCTGRELRYLRDDRERPDPPADRSGDRARYRTSDA